MEKKYVQPDVEFKRVLSMETVAADMSGDDNELDIGDTGWGDF